MEEEINQVTTDQNGQEDLQEAVQQAQDEQNNGENVNLGKFKDVSSLLTAYNNLQAEFTKKCQKLSEITKNCDNNACALPQKDEWQQKVDHFLADHEEARAYSTEISNVLLNNADIYNSENALENAWTKVLIEKTNSLTNKLQDKEFLVNLVETNEEVKKQVIQNYVNSLKEKHSPQLMDTSATSFTIVKNQDVKTLEDASKLVKSMF